MVMCHTVKSEHFTANINDINFKIYVNVAISHITHILTLVSSTSASSSLDDSTARCTLALLAEVLFTGESSSSASLTVVAFEADSFRGLLGEPVDPEEAAAPLPKNDLKFSIPPWVSVCEFSDFAD